MRIDQIAAVALVLMAIDIVALADNDVPTGSVANTAAATKELNLPATPAQYRDELPPHFLTAAAKAFDDTPPDNPVTDEGALLGRVLFYDTRLSANGTISCASCHQQEHAFTDARRVSRGHAGEETDRNSMSLVNLRFSKAGKFWDERAKTLEQQVLIPLQSRVEMGQELNALVKVLQEDERYAKLFKDAFGDPAINSERIAKALAQFLRSLVSYRSKYDADLAAAGDESKDFLNFTASENRGKSLFLEKCAICHRDGRGRQSAFFTSFRSLNNGVDATADVADGGAGDITLIPSDIGLFRPSDLRNVEFTAPYMHDGRFQTLEDVLEHYSGGVQHHPTVSGFVFRMQFSDQEKAAIIAFLKTLSDEAFLHDPRFSNPWNDTAVPREAAAESQAAGTTANSVESAVLTTAERAQRLAKRSGLPRGEARNYLRDLDRNGDEALSLDESKQLAELLLEVGPPARFDRRRFTTREMRVNLGEEGPPPALMAFDKDKDSRLSAVELPKSRNHLLDIADLNGDGSLDRNEAAKFETVERFLTLQVNDRDRTRMVRLVESLKLDEKEAKQAIHALREAQAELQRHKAALDANLTEQLQAKLGPSPFARFQDLLLSKQDAVALAMRSGGDTVDSMQERIFEFDDNHDKQLDRQELDALSVILDETPGGFGTKRLPLPTTEQYARRIMARDADSDGLVSIDEVPERLRFLVDRGDDDSDQQLTRAELDDCLRNTAYQRFLAEGVYVGGGFVNAFTQSARLLDELDLDDDVKVQACALLDAHEYSIQASIDKSVSDQYRRLRDALSKAAVSAASR